MTRRFLQSTLIVLAGTAIVKILALLRELVIASEFGVSADLDSFYLAFGLTGLVASTLFGSLQTAFVAAVSGRGQQSSRQEVSHLFQSLTALSILLVLLISILYFTSRSFIFPVIFSSVHSDQQSYIQSLTTGLLVYFLFSAFNLLSYGLLQALKSFALFSVLPALTPLISIMVLLSPLPASLGVETLVFAFGCGAICETAFLLYFLRKYGIRLKFGRPQITSLTKRVFGESVHLFYGMIFAASILFVDHIMAAGAGTGSVSLLAYAQRIPRLLIAVAIAILGTTTLPYFSELAAVRDWKKCRDLLVQLILWSTLLSTVIIGVLIACSHLLVSLLFQRGAFLAEYTSAVSSLQQVYFLAVPPYIVGIFVTRLLIGLGRSRLLAFITFVNFSLNIFLNWVFLQYFGLAGIAWATVVVNSLSLILQLSLLRLIAPQVLAFRTS